MSDVPVPRTNSAPVRLQDMTFCWTVAGAGAVAMAAGGVQLAVGSQFGLYLLGLGVFWVAVVARTFVVVDDAGVEVHGLWRTTRVPLDQIAALEVHVLGFLDRGRSVLRFHLDSGACVDVPAGVVPIGPSKFHGRVAAVVADRMQALGRSLVVPHELRHL